MENGVPTCVPLVAPCKVQRVSQFFTIAKTVMAMCDGIHLFVEVHSNGAWSMDSSYGIQ